MMLWMLNCWSLCVRCLVAAIQHLIWEFKPVFWKGQDSLWVYPQELCRIYRIRHCLLAICLCVCIMTWISYCTDYLLSLESALKYTFAIQKETKTKALWRNRTTGTEKKKKSEKWLGVFYWSIKIMNNCRCLHVYIRSGEDKVRAAAVSCHLIRSRFLLFFYSLQGSDSTSNIVFTVYLQCRTDFSISSSDWVKTLTNETFQLICDFLEKVIVHFSNAVFSKHDV